MRLLIDQPIYLEIEQPDLGFLTKNTIFFKDSHILCQKCDLPEDTIYSFMYMLESYGYEVGLGMYEIGRFHLILK